MQSTIPIRHRPAVTLERSPFDFAAIFTGLLVLTLLIGLLTWQFWHANRIFSGVSIAGFPVGGLTRAGAVGQLHQHRQTYPLPPVSLYYGRQQWPLTGEAVGAQADWLAAINDAYLVGRGGNFAERIGKQGLAALQGQEIHPALTFNPAGLRYAISQIANTVRQPGRPGSQIGTVRIAAQPGLDVDVEATLQAVLQTLQTTSSDKVVRVPLAVIELPPPDALPVETSATAIASAPVLMPLLLRNPTGAGEFALDPATLSRLLVGANPPRLDEDGLRTLLAEWAAQVSLPARDARLRFNPETGGVTVLQPSQAGRQLDVDATLTAIQQAVGTGATQADLALVAVPPAVDMNRIAEMGIRELVASGTTYFKGSSAERVHNIQAGAAKLDGVVIPPGDYFSFNQFVEDVTAANGFADSLVIMGKQTLFGAGGGICQVSTTIFRAAYAGGFPITERTNHGYVVDWYGEPGLDATIYTPVLDFSFQNDTGAYLLVEPLVDPGGVITFNLYGSKPNRVVTISAPLQSDIRKAEPPEFRIDETLAKDQRKQTEWEHDGMTVAVTRTIVENGTTRTDTTVSKYEPWRAVYLVGPGTEIPATPVPTTAVTTTVDVAATDEITASAP